MTGVQALRPGVPFLVFRKSTPRKWVLYALKTSTDMPARVVRMLMSPASYIS